MKIYLRMFEYLLPRGKIVGAVGSNYEQDEYIAIRKRLLHKGYAIFKVEKIMLHKYNGTTEVVEYLTHLVYVDTLEQAKTYLQNEFNLEIEI